MTKLLNIVKDLYNPEELKKNPLEIVLRINSWEKEYFAWSKKTLRDASQNLDRVATQEEHMRSVLSLFPLAVIFPTRLLQDVVYFLQGTTLKDAFWKHLLDLEQQTHDYYVAQEIVESGIHTLTECLQAYRNCPEGGLVIEAIKLSDNLASLCEQIGDYSSDLFILGKSHYSMLFPDESLVDLPKYL